MKNARWSFNEDQELIRLVKEHGKNWKVISRNFPNKTESQCCYRYKNKLDPKINIGRWSEEEENKLIILKKEYGTRWKIISKHLEGRSPEAIKRKWHQKLCKVSEHSSDTNISSQSIPITPLSQTRGFPPLTNSTSFTISTPSSPLLSSTAPIQNNIYNDDLESYFKEYYELSIHEDNSI